MDEASAAAAITAGGKPVSATTLAKLLASPKPSVRNKAVRLLSSLLPSLSLSSNSLLKIWKGLFFCYWHSDKPQYQASLARSIASLISGNSPDFSSSFLDSSLLTLRREWVSIDFLRLDKFYLLLRFLLRHTFTLLQSQAWDQTLVSEIISIVEQRALFPSDQGTPSAKGFSYHIAEIFLDELKGFLPVTKETLDVLFRPFLNILERSSDKVLVNKVKVNVFDKVLINGGRYMGAKKEGGEIERGSEAEKFGIIGLIMGFSAKFLSLAESAETVQANKKVLHGLREEFLKLERELEKSGIEISMPKMERIEFPSTENGGGLDEKLSKKRKKKEKKSVDESDSKNKNKNKNKENKESKKSKKNKAELVIEENKTLLEESNEEIGSTNGGDERESETLDTINFDDTIISNLQKQFERAAAEAGIKNEIKIKIPKKRKRTKSAIGMDASSGDVNGEDDNLTEIEITPAVPKKKKRVKSAGKLDVSSGEGNGEEEISLSSTKKVRFSMKNNLIWKPHSSPLPPHDLRLPPSATPRGSALKKGVPPGPIKDPSSPVVARIRRKPRAKSVVKNVTSSGAIKRLRKLQSLSA